MHVAIQKNQVILIHRHFLCNEEGSKFKRLHLYANIFSDKGYVFIAAMKSVSELPKALKMFAKEVVVPEKIISDSYKCHKSKEVRQLCHKIGTTLRVLEGSIQ